jgi:hypothetical protein
MEVSLGHPILLVRMGYGAATRKCEEQRFDVVPQ